MNGVPNSPGTPILTMHKGKLRLASWNARALFHQSDSVRRASRIAILRQYLPLVDIFVIQKSHGSWEDVITEFSDFSFLFEIQLSEGPRAAGGVITFVR